MLYARDFDTLIKFLSYLITVDIRYQTLYNDQINARALIGQSAMGYCADKPMKNFAVFSIII